MNATDHPETIPNTKPIPATAQSSQAPEAPTRLSFTTALSINIFGAATVLTIPAFFVFPIGHLADNTPTLIAGTIMFLIAYTPFAYQSLKPTSRPNKHQPHNPPHMIGSPNSKHPTLRRQT